MKRNWIIIAGLALFAAGCSSGGNESTAPAGTTTGGATASTSPYTPIQATFNDHCIGCHSSGNAKGGIDLSSYAGVMKGGDDGPIVTAGEPDKSKIVDALRGRNGAMQMPKGKAPLPEEDIKKVEDWIKNGAKES